MECQNLKTKRMKNLNIIFILLYLLFSAETNAQKGKLSSKIIVDLPTSCIQLSPDKNFIAIADDTEDPLGFQKLKEIHKIRILNSNNLSKIFEFIGHDESIESINFSCDSKKLVSTDKKGTIIIWELTKGQQICRIETGEWVHNAKFCNSGNEIVAIQGYDKIALIYNINGKQICKLEAKEQINDLEINNKTNEIYLGCFNEIQVWSLVSREKTQSLSFSGLMCMRFDNDYSQLVIGVSNGDIILLSNELKIENILKGHFKPVLSISFSFDNSKLASASSDQTARIWNIKKQNELITLTNEHKGSVEAIEFISNKNEFITGGENKELKIWK